MAQYPQQPNPWQPVQPNAQQQQAYGQQQYAAAAPNPWVPVQQPQQQQQAQQHFYMPEAQQQPHMAAGAGAGPGMDAFMTGFAGNMLRQQGQTYLQRGQAFMQSKMGFLSGGLIHYHFSITPEYVRSKLLMLLAPFLKKWNYTRVLEQISGGHKYLPPRQDVNAPDLYIPAMAAWTYCILIGVASLAAGRFKPDIVYNTASGTLLAWLLHTLLLKVTLHLLGIASAVPFLELAAYAGYCFVAGCACLLAAMTLGSMGYHVVWAYASLAQAIFLVRTMKRVIFQEARHYSMESTRHNYLLLGLAVFQFPLNAWLARLPAA